MVICAKTISLNLDCILCGAQCGLNRSGFIPIAPSHHEGGAGRMTAVLSCQFSVLSKSNRRRPYPVLRTENREQRTRSALALRELEALARTLLSVLLTFLAACIAGEEPFSFQSFAQFNVELEQRAGNAHLHSVGLAVNTTAGDTGGNVDSALALGGC